jgi:8-oxo-dGTP pyrophosphatase MutT (NUDIX family)
VSREAKPASRAALRQIRLLSIRESRDVSFCRKHEVLPALKKSHQVAAIPIRRSKRGKVDVLLVTSRETKRWIVPKGWPWKGRPDCEAAAGEAKEEAGVIGEVTPEPVGSFSYLKRRKNGDLPVSVDVFVIEVTKLLDKYAESKQRERRWFTPAEAAGQVDEPELGALILQLAKAS